MATSLFIKARTNETIQRILNLNDSSQQTERDAIQKDINMISTEMENPTLSCLRKLKEAGKTAGFDVAKLSSKLNEAKHYWS